MVTMSEAERDIMRRHVGYWSSKIATGEALLFGPVADPKAGYGIGVIRVDDLAAMHTLRNSDPAMQSGVGFTYEITPMPQVITPQG